MAESQLGNTIEEAAELAANILASIIPEANCVAQEWDNRIDCFIVLDGVVFGEMVALPNITEQRIRETADRLLKKQLGQQVSLKDELWSPVRIVRTADLP
jgi:hypothetical protein